MLSLLIVALLGLGLTALTLLRVANPLREGRDALQRGQSALVHGNRTAGAAFDEAGVAFERARQATEGVVGRLSRMVPIVGGNARVADALALAGADAAEAGGHLADAVSGLPGGFEALAPRRGAIPLQALVGIVPDVSAAAGLIQGGLFDLQQSPGGLLLAPVASARDQALETFEAASGTLQSASGLLEVLPDLAGAHRPTHYFFGAANPAELRGTGGLIGAFAIVTLDHGRFDISQFQPIEVLHDLPAKRLPAPNPDFRANYDQFGGAGDWSNINMTPDFPSAARAIKVLYERNTGRSIDGVMVADPVALQSLLKVTGPADVPGLHTVIDAQNVVAFTEQRAYSLFRTSTERKVVLGLAASSVLNQFLGMAGKGAERVQAVAESASAGHLVVYADDPWVERGLRAAGVAGGLTIPVGGGDALSVIVNSASGSKIDYWSTRSISYRVKLQEGGDATAATDVTLRNGAPTHGEPRYVIGPFPGIGLKPGDARSLVSIYCAPGCRGFDSTRDGRPVEVRLGSELGFSWYQDYPTLHSKASSTFHLGTLVPGVWQGNDRGGIYSLLFLDQPATHPTSLQIEVTAPPGMHITSTSLPMHVDGDTATWEGTPTYRMPLRITFAPSLPVRAWRTLTGWLP